VMATRPTGTFSRSAMHSSWLSSSTRISVIWRQVCRSPRCAARAKSPLFPCVRY
jgi:hypothetical protein